MLQHFLAGFVTSFLSFWAGVAYQSWRDKVVLGPRNDRDGRGRAGAAD